MLQFFEVPPGGSVVSPLFFPFFSLSFCFLFLLLCLGRIFFAFFAFFSHFFRFLCDSFPSLRSLFKKNCLPSYVLASS